MYCRVTLNQKRRQHKQEMQNSKVGATERHKKHREFLAECIEWDEWLTELRETKLIAKARKMDVYLEDLPAPPVDDDDPSRSPHFRVGTFDGELLRPESYHALAKAMRERAPAYRKERREVWDLCLRAGAVLTGVIGSLIGLVAAFKK